MDTSFNFKILKTDLETLKKIMSVNLDAICMYELACQRTEDQSTRLYFSDLITLHYKTLRNLQVYVKDISQNYFFEYSNIDIIKNSDQLLNEITSHLSLVGGSLIDQLENVESQCIHAIELAMSTDSISSSTKHVLMREHIHLQRSQKYMLSLKNSLKAA